MEEMKIKENNLNIDTSKVIHKEKLDTTNKKNNNNLAKSGQRLFGEVYICNEQTKNEFFRVDEFNTFDVLKFQGSEDHLIVFFRDQKNQHRIAAIEKKKIRLKKRKKLDLSGAIKKWDLNGIGRILKIKFQKSKVFLLSDCGNLYSLPMENPSETVLDQIQKPILVPFSPKQKIKSVACGWNHSLALTEGGEVYAWGQGYQGQLGIPNMSICTRPKNLPFFNKFIFLKCEAYSNRQTQIITAQSKENIKNFKVLRKCKKIYASANHSFAITDSEDVYAWGDNSLGVLGLPQFIGKNVTLPQIIQFNTLRSQNSQENGLVNSFPKEPLSPINKEISQPWTKEIKIRTLSTCQTQTFFMTVSGKLFVSGLKKGQLGIPSELLISEEYERSNLRIIKEPREIFQDENGETVPAFGKIQTSFRKSVALSKSGDVFVWGRGPLGLGNVLKVDCPFKLKLSSFPVRASKILASGSSFAMFVPCLFNSIKPQICFSNGGTLCNILGFGIIENEKKPLARISIPLIIPGEAPSRISKVVPLIYESTLPSFFLETPSFLEKNIFFPAEARIEISLDGVHFMETGLELMIMDSKVKIQQISPRFMSVKGGQELKIRLNHNHIFQKSDFINEAKNETRTQEESESASGYLEKILTNNSQDLMIAFKRILPEENAPSFKTLKNNSVIDNALFLRQKMIKADFRKSEIGLLEANSHNTSKEKLSNHRGISSLSKQNLSSSGRNIKKLNLSQNLNEPNSAKRSGIDLSSLTSRPSLLQTMSKSTQRRKESEKKMAERSKQSMEDDEDTSGWKLVPAKLKEGKIVCETPELDLQTGDLRLFEKHSVLEKIRDNKFNTDGKKLLNEVSQWLENQSYLKHSKELEREASLKAIKRMIISAENKKIITPEEINAKFLNIDFNLKPKKSVTQIETSRSATAMEVLKEQILEEVKDVWGFFHFWIDVSLNGQQILGRPFKLTFYKLELDGLYPNNCLISGSIPVFFKGKGIFECDYKKVKIKRGSYERVIEPEWHSETQQMFFYMPPFEWLRASSESNRALPSEEFMMKCINGQVSVFEAFPDLKNKENTNLTQTNDTTSLMKESIQLESNQVNDLANSAENQIPSNQKNQTLESNQNKDGQDESRKMKLESNLSPEIFQTEGTPEDPKGHSVQIFLSLSSGHWQYAGNILYYEPQISSVFPFNIPEEANVESLSKTLTCPKKWEYFDFYFGEDFEPLPNPLTNCIEQAKISTELENIDEVPEPNPKNGTKSKNKNTKKPQSSKPKTAKELEKAWETLKENLKTQPRAPGDYLILLSKKGFVLPDPDKPKLKFSFQKFSNESEGWFCNPHMILVKIPEMPFVKPLPEPVPVEEEVETPSNNKKKSKKEGKAEEIEMWEVKPVDIRLSLNGQQFGPILSQSFNFVFIDKSVPESERLDIRNLVIHKKKPKAKK